jgi:mevalonate kinase
VKTGATYVNGDSVGPSAGFLDIAPGAVLVLADSGERSNTADVQSRLEAFLGQRKGDRIMEKLVAVSETISLQSANALRKGDFEYVGTMFNENHYLLQALNVSTSRLDELRVVAMDTGALGAKLTGSGCGGFLLAVCYPDALKAVCTGLRKRGVSVFFKQLTEEL